MDNIVGAPQQVIPQMEEPNVMSRPLRGCSPAATGPRLIARSTVRAAARTTSTATTASVGRCSGSLATNMNDF